MPNIYNHISSNKRETVLVIALFIGVVSFLGYFIGEVFQPGSGYFYIGIALVFSGISSLVSYYNSDKIVLALSGAKEVKYEDNPSLHDLVDNMCIASGLPKPRVFMIHDTALNAFATGRDPQHSVICFTSGIVNTLEKRELEGVIAHELSHIQNYDVRLMSIVSILVGAVTLLADWFTRGMFYGSRDRRSRVSSEIGGILMIVGIILVILSPVIAALIKMALSRKREFLADASAAMMTRHPKGLADALRKLAGDREILEAANGATAHMYIVHPLKGQSGLSSLFNTHPPIQERINRLESM